MPRFIQEYRLTAENTQITLPSCFKVLGITKVSNYFLLIVEIWGNPSLIVDIDIRVFRKEEYMLPEATYLGHALVGENIYHFSYTSGEVVDEGSDGGEPIDVSPLVPRLLHQPIVSFAGGMKEL